jgi:hypothetical protein
MGKPSGLAQGSLDLLVLKTISLQPQARLGHRQAHPTGIQRCARGAAGLLHAGRHRLEGLIRARGSETEGGRHPKFLLTAAGRAQLEREREGWSRLSTAISPVVERT